jgi:FkbM family methyltransferase
VSTTVGRGEHFRQAGWLERLTTRLRGGAARPAPASLRRFHEFLLDHAPGDHLVSTLPGGERIRVAARYRQLGWNPEEYNAFRAAVRPGATVLDVGANVGAYTLLFARWAGPTGRVVAFEPAPDAAAGLRRHIELNELSATVDVQQCAVSYSVGTARFACTEASGANAIVVGESGTDAIEVATVTLDAFCSRGRVVPDVIKIDVEGAELDVLKGARQVLAFGGLQVFLELHPASWKARGIGEQAIREELASQRLAAEPLAPGLDIWRTEGISVRLRRA